MPYNWNNYNRHKKKKNNRPDHQPGHRAAFEKNKKKILQSQEICGICGKPVNKLLKFPDPMSATIDHIIPVSRGGHPSALDNLQLAHLSCNRKKSDKLKNELFNDSGIKQSKKIFDSTDPAGLPLLINWCDYDSINGNYEKLLDEAENIRSKGKIITARGIINAKE